MKLVDLNILIYAVNRDSPLHKPARQWWEGCLSGHENIGLAWAVILGFLRLTTNPRVMSRPIPTGVAMEIMNDWLEQAPVRQVVPTQRHWGILREIISPLGTAGNLTTDAHLAALTIEHGAVLYSTDGDFRRFAGLRWADPLRQE